VSAARLAAAAGVGVLVTSSELVAEALSGADIGTWFEPGGVRAGPESDSVTGPAPLGRMAP